VCTALRSVRSVYDAYARDALLRIAFSHSGA
jgi:hypothetical protein